MTQPGMKNQSTKMMLFPNKVKTYKQSSSNKYSKKRQGIRPEDSPRSNLSLLLLEQEFI